LAFNTPIIAIYSPFYTNLNHPTKQQIVNKRNMSGIISAAATVPVFYRVFFRYFDPVVALYGVYVNIIDPATAVPNLVPGSRYDPNQVFFFYQCGGLALTIAFITATIHRYSDDLTVWRLLQLGLFLSDIVALGGIYLSLSRQGKLSASSWTSDDRGVLTSYVGITVIRLAFLSNIGF
jgi:hypothetical protein